MRICIWKDDKGNNFYKNDTTRSLCLIGNSVSSDDTWKVTRLGDMLRKDPSENNMNAFDKQRHKREERL